MQWIASSRVSGWRTLAATFVLVVAASAAMACGGDGTPAAGTASPVGTTTGSESPSAVVSGSLTEAEQRDAEELVDGILADGHVTEAEYERAILAMVQCFDAHGVEHGTPYWYTAEYVPRFVVETRVPLLEPGQVHPSDLCSRAYEADIQIQWVKQHEPTESERQAREQEAVDCVAALGYDVYDFEAALAIMRGLREQPGWGPVNRCIIGAIQGAAAVGGVVTSLWAT